MVRDPNHDVLFEPLRIGPKILRNRFYQVPHCTGFGTYKPWTQAAHRAVKAEGGWAAVCTEFCSFSPDSDEEPIISARLWDRHDLEALSVMCDEVHRHGALAGIELHHGGVQSARAESRWPALAPSQLAGDINGVVPKTMERTDIEWVQKEWAEAANRARDAGFDIIYVYGAHSYLLAQFLSSYYNKRTDEYGGTLENRARLWIETLERVRAEVGADCAIAVRMSVDALSREGTRLDESLEFIRMADPLVDLWDVTLGSLRHSEREAASSRFYPEGHQLEITGRVREATAKPLVGVSRLTDPDLMASIIRSGTLDLIGAARPSIADPYIPKKIDEGQLEDIRECIGSNQCIWKAVEGRHMGCVQNPTVGEEYRRGWHPEYYSPFGPPSKSILIVGGGPSGMECAMALGRRGAPAVHLVEANERLGGSIRWVPDLPRMAAWRRVVTYRETQLRKLPNVDVILGSELSAGNVRDYGADVIILATGAYWSTDGVNRLTHLPIPGADAMQPYCLTPEQIMVEGKRPPGRRVVVYDFDGYFVAVGVAELLSSEGYEVELVSGLWGIALEMDHTIEGPPMRRRLAEAGIAMETSVLLTAVEAGGLSGRNAEGGSWERQADAVVLVTQRVSDDRLYLELQAPELDLRSRGAELYRVGDCVAPRLLADVIFDGHRLARELDSGNPETPLAYRREWIPAPREPALADTIVASETA